MSLLATWLPPVAWTTLVLAMSSGPFSAENTGGLLKPLLAALLPWLGPAHLDLIHLVIRKAGHVTEYAILAALWYRAFARRAAPGPAWLALAVAVACAVVDESHQSMVPSRTGSVGDMMLDTAGALAAVLPAGLGWRRAIEVATGCLLWTAAAGGLAALGLHLAAGAGGGALWITVPIAALALAYRWRKSVSSS